MPIAKSIPSSRRERSLSCGTPVYASATLGLFLIGATGLPLVFAAQQGVGQALSKKDRQSTVLPPKTIKAVVPHDAGDFIDGHYWALIIGIDQYPAFDQDIQLAAARKSAERVARLLVERYGFLKDRVIELYDESASLLGIINALYTLEGSLGDKDSLFIYYAGQGGYMSAGTGGGHTEKRGYWIPSDAEKDNPSYYLHNSDLKDFLVTIPARHIYVVVDSVFGGPLAGTVRRFGAGPASVRDLYARKSRWVLASGGLHSAPDLADSSKEGYSAFAWRFIRVLEDNKRPYLLAGELVEHMTFTAASGAPGLSPRGAPMPTAGDGGGQFVLRLRKEFQKGPNAEQPDPAGRVAERANVPALGKGPSMPRVSERKDAGGLQPQERAPKEAKSEQETANKKKATEKKPIEEARVRPFEAPQQAGREITATDGVPMVLVPAGEFTMGDNEEKPPHRVYVDAFYIDKYELTTSRYAQFLRATGRNPPGHWNEVNVANHGERPVIGVEWHDAEAYCRWAGKRLLTEAEWEKAARGTDGRRYPWGNEQPSGQKANFGKCCDWKGYAMLAPAGSLEPGKSPYGVHDMAGNVYEWVADWYAQNYYQHSPYRNPKGPATGEYKVLRGGSWHSRHSDVRSAARFWDVPMAQTAALGFRCVRDGQR